MNPRVLCDTGPLVALRDEEDPEHERCLEAAKRLPPAPLVTTWPCITEAMYLLGDAGGPNRNKSFAAQERLWASLESGHILVHDLSAEERKRMHDLMRRYKDLPMDLADASLVAAAEALNLKQVFTLDGHFYAYRIHGRDAFDVIS